ncbi:MAG: transglycosylase SLT domain-containing protein [Endomicrobium sp.]|nr:transglycosylase SLT domain-containing protein [Endomicrobium sp.]
MNLYAIIPHMGVHKSLPLLFFMLIHQFSYGSAAGHTKKIDNSYYALSLTESISDEEGNHLISQISKALSNAQSDANAKTEILEAEIHYEKSIAAFKTGDFAKAKKHFDLFVEKIKMTNIDPGLYFFIFDDAGEIITKLKRIYSSSSAMISSSLNGYAIPMSIENNDIVEKYISVYSSDKAVKKALEKSGAYKNIILKTLRDFNLPEELFYLPVVESFYNINDVGNAGEIGLWQIMAHRGRALGLQINYWIDERKDPEKSTEAACLYLKRLYIMLNDWHLALAAYNRGEFGLIRDMKFSNATNISEMISRKAIPKETQNYIPKFIAAVTIGDNLEKYNFKDLKYEEPLEYDKYQTNKIIDLKIAAQCAETTVEEIKRLNPALKAWSTPHGYPNFELKIPYGSKERFIENIALVKDLNPSPELIKHKVLKGEYIEKIAAKYRTTTKEVYNDNSNLSKQKYLRPGQIIFIRPGKKYYNS